MTKPIKPLKTKRNIFGWLFVTSLILFLTVNHFNTIRSDKKADPLQPPKNYGNEEPAQNNNTNTTQDNGGMMAKLTAPPLETENIKDKEEKPDNTAGPNTSNLQARANIEDNLKVAAPSGGSASLSPQEEKTSSALVSQLSFISMITSITSLIGFFSTTFLAWRKEKRENNQAEINLKLKELEIRKLEAEIAKNKHA